MPVFLKRIGAAVLMTGLLAVGQQALAQNKPAAPAAPAAKPAAPAAKPAQPAQPAQAPAPQAGAPQQGGPVRVELQPSQADWTKVCGNDPATGKELCYTTRDFGQGPDQPPVLALAIYDPKGDDTKIVRLLLPPGLLLRPGFRFMVDQGAPVEGTFEICFPNGCFAEARVRTAAIDGLKKGTLLNISVKNQFNNEVTFALPLAGFGKAFDGAAIDPKVLEDQQKQAVEQQKALQEQLQKKAEDERKRLESQGGAPAQPAPAK